MNIKCVTLQLYANSFDNLDEMEKFLIKQSILDKYIKKYIELSKKNKLTEKLLQKKGPAPDGSIKEFHQTSKEIAASLSDSITPKNNN